MKKERIETIPFEVVSKNAPLSNQELEFDTTKKYEPQPFSYEPYILAAVAIFTLFCALGFWLDCITYKIK